MREYFDCKIVSYNDEKDRMAIVTLPSSSACIAAQEACEYWSRNTYIHFKDGDKITVEVSQNGAGEEYVVSAYATIAFESDEAEGDK